MAKQLSNILPLFFEHPLTQRTLRIFETVTNVITNSTWLIHFGLDYPTHLRQSFNHRRLTAATGVASAPLKSRARDWEMFVALYKSDSISKKKNPNTHHNWAALLLFLLQLQLRLPPPNDLSNLGCIVAQTNREAQRRLKVPTISSNAAGTQTEYPEWVPTHSAGTRVAMNQAKW